MPRVGFEPTRAKAHAILSRTRKPIPPPRLFLFYQHQKTCQIINFLLKLKL